MPSKPPVKYPVGTRWLMRDGTYDRFFGKEEMKGLLFVDGKAYVEVVVIHEPYRLARTGRYMITVRPVTHQSNYGIGVTSAGYARKGEDGLRRLREKH